jgi:hypothetical protein
VPTTRPDNVPVPPFVTLIVAPAGFAPPAVVLKEAVLATREMCGAVAGCVVCSPPLQLSMPGPSRPTTAMQRRVDDTQRGDEFFR